MGYAVSDFICILSRLPNPRVDHPQSMKVSAIKQNISPPNHGRDVCSELFRKKVTLEHAEMVMCYSGCEQWTINIAYFCHKVNLRHFRMGLDLAFGRTEQRNREIKLNYGTFDPRNG